MSHGRTLAATLAAKRENQAHSEASSTAHPLLSKVSWIGRAACLLLVVSFAWLRGGVDFSHQVWMGGLLLIGLVVWWIERISGQMGSDRKMPLVAAPLILGIVLGLVQLVPLPDSLSSLLASKQNELLELFASPAEMMHSPETPTASISLDTNSGRNQVSLLVFALASLLLGSHFFKSSRHAIVFFVVVATNAAFVSIAGLLQRVPISGATVLSNELVSGVLPFGTFVNRNNAACYMLMGMAAAAGLLYWNLFGEPTKKRPRQIISKEIPVWRQVQQRIGIFFAEMTLARCACLFLFSLIILGIIASLSRGGVLALLVAGLLTAMTYGIVRDSESRIGWAAIALLGVIGLSLWLGFGTRLAARFDELNSQDSVTKLNRIRNWSDTFPAVIDFGTLGSGLGSYHAVHRLYRQDLEERMFENADNQYFQTLVEAGWLGFVLLIAAIAIVVWSALFISKKGTSTRTLAIGVAGMFLITSIGLTSLMDFGLIIPQNTVLMAMFVGMTAYHTHSFAARLKKKFFLRRELPQWATLVVAAGVFVGVLLSTWYLTGLAKMENLDARKLLREDQLTLPREKTEEQIGKLEPLLKLTPTYWGYRRLGELYLHRYRLSRFEQIENHLAESPANLWDSTNLVNMHEQMSQLKRIGDRRLIEAYAAALEAEQFIVPAWRALIASRNLLPFQSDVQLMLAQIQSVFGDDKMSQVCLDRAYRTAPTNADFAYIIGLMQLHSERIDDATANWRRCISLKPNPYFAKIMDRIHSLPSDDWRIEPALVLKDVVPKEPFLLFAFGSNHLAGEKYTDLNQECLRQADELLGTQTQHSDSKAVALWIKVKLGLNQKKEALEKMKWLMQLSPPDIRIEDLRFEMAKLQFELNMVSEAYEEIKWLRKNDLANVKRYSGLYEQLRQHLSIKNGE